VGRLGAAGEGVPDTLFLFKFATKLFTLVPDGDLGPFAVLGPRICPKDVLDRGVLGVFSDSWLGDALRESFRDETLP
jgi:hypothetical protein